MAIIGRLFQIGFVLLGHGLAHYAGVLVRRVSWLRTRLPPTELSKPDRLRSVLESLGGSFVKLGQMLALQPDILPFEYCHALYSLLDRVKPVAADEIEAVFREETGKAPSEVFDSFDRKAIASGSIGQVHVAVFGGRKVAVKIQRPDTQSSFKRDVRLMNSAVWVIRFLRLKLLAWMIDPLTEFAEWTVEELDFCREARYMNQLRQNAAENKRERVPALVMEFTTRRVLVIEFLDGVTLLDHIRLTEQKAPRHQARLAADGFDGDEFARGIIDNFLGDAFLHGMFHADLHPANLMILPGNVVGYLDFGICGSVSMRTRHMLIAMTLAYSRNDIPSLCEKFFAVSSLDERSDPDGFRSGLKRLSEKWYKGDEDTPSLKTTTTMVMLDMLKLSRATRIWPQRDVIKYIRSAIAIDGLIRQFAPHFNVGHHLAVSCRRNLAAHARKSLCSHDALINWSHATANLVQNGAFRLSSLLERVGESGSSRSSTNRQEKQKQRRTLAWPLVVVAGVVGTLAITTNPTLQFGVNLFTAQVAVVGMTLFAMWRNTSRSSLLRA
jgi:predicted unusual protein kinase regulating ubiquinone biosynthesis (AarF/ABC1/UbiB family)